MKRTDMENANENATLCDPAVPDTHQGCSTPMWDSPPARTNPMKIVLIGIHRSITEYHVNSADQSNPHTSPHVIFSSHPIGFPWFPCQICQVGSSENGKAATSPTFVASALEDRLRDALRRSRRLKPDADAEPQRDRLDDGYPVAPCISSPLNNLKHLKRILEHGIARVMNSIMQFICSEIK